MSYHRVTCVLLVVAALLVTATPRAFAAEAFVPIDEVRPGDRCIGKSVFAGTEIEEFDVEILAIVRGTAPGSDVIVGRASGAVLDVAGIPQGMSGSPVYLDGRLVGAISATWAFSKEPIAAITPIGEMLPALDDGGAEPSATGGALGMSLLPPDERNASRLTRLMEMAGVEPWSPPEAGAAVGTYGGRDLVPLALPLAVSGAGGRVLDRVADVLSGCGLVPVLAAGGTHEAPTAEPVPGSAIGVQFVGGDANWCGIGTLTHRDGDRLIAFGHPIFGAGNVRMPLVSAYVHTVLPLASVSFKYASGGELIGGVYSDRRRGVGARLGASPPTIPLDVDVVSATGQASHYEFRIIPTRPHAAVFSGLVSSGAIVEAALTAGHSLVEMRATVETDDDSVTYETVFESPEPALRAGGELAMLMDLLVWNAYEQKDVRGVSLEVKLTDGELWAAIEGVSVDRATYAPGDDVELAVRLRDRQGGLRTEKMTLTVPPTVDRETLTVRVGGAAAFHEWDADRLAGGLRPRTYEQLKWLIESSLPGNVVVAQLLSDRPGLSLSGEELRGLPGRAALAIGSSLASGSAVPTDQSVLSEAKLEADREVRGYHEFALFVRRDR